LRVWPEAAFRGMRLNSDQKLCYLAAGISLLALGIVGCKSKPPETAAADQGSNHSCRPTWNPDSPGARRRSSLRPVPTQGRGCIQQRQLLCPGGQGAGPRSGPAWTPRQEYRVAAGGNQGAGAEDSAEARYPRGRRRVPRPEQLEMEGLGRRLPRPGCWISCAKHKLIVTGRQVPK